MPSAICSDRDALTASIVGSIVGWFRLLLLLFVQQVDPTLANPLDNHWEDWQTQVVQKKAGPDATLKFEHESRSCREVYYHHHDLTLERRIARKVAAAFGYRQIRYVQSDGWTHEYRPHVSGIFSTRWRGLSLEDRNALELRFFEDQKSKIRYRNSPMIGYPMKRGRWRVMPALGADLAFDLTGPKAGTLTRLRTTAGVLIQPTERFRADLYVTRQGKDLQLEEGEVWDTFWVRGLELRYSF